MLIARSLDGPRTTLESRNAAQVIPYTLVMCPTPVGMYERAGVAGRDKVPSGMATSHEDNVSCAVGRFSRSGETAERAPAACIGMTSDLRGDFEAGGARDPASS